MSKEELNQYIENILPEIGKDAQNGVPFTSQMYFEEHSISHENGGYIIDKLLEFDLVRSSPKYRSELILTSFGHEILRDHGWYSFLSKQAAERQAAAEREQAMLEAAENRQREEDRRARQNLSLTEEATRAAKNSALAAWGSVVATIITSLFSLYASTNTSFGVDQLKAELDSLKKEITLPKETNRNSTESNLSLKSVKDSSQAFRKDTSAR